MRKVYVLDACALIALLRDEEGAEAIAMLYQQAEAGMAKLIMNRLNLLEVYYGFYRDKGKKYADDILSSIEQSVVDICEFRAEIFKEAGRLKATYKISLADGVVLAEAYVSEGIILTADHHELDLVEKNENIEFCWIR